ncbi:MAG: hypothetical protein COW67_03025 [Flavobacteriales bacterium CG18_big_fil_WC_8_21_14_2_50_32_9]|nr:MAG: hypothetical protein COW67_03025 [Flavobacteriales bacterium CG18_big_fil_WC_8_21_14_2_50_32_9]
MSFKALTISIGLLSGAGFIMQGIPRHQPESPQEILVAQNTVVQHAMFHLRFAPGDTLNYKLSWGPASNAASYIVTVTATGSGWEGLPSETPVNVTTFSFAARNAEWDTVTFTASVWGARGSRISKVPATVSWRAVRGVGTPGPITVDSSLIQVALLLTPDSVALAFGEQVQFCSFLLALDNKWRIAEVNHAIPICRARYDSLPANQRLPNYPIAMEPDIGPQSSFEVRIVEHQGVVRPKIYAAAN